MYNFQNLSNKCPTKRKPKIFGFKNVMERGIRKIVTFAIP